MIRAALPLLDRGSLFRLPTRVLVLLAAAVLINYIDRATLAIASPLLQTEFAYSNSQMGLLLSAFFWSYAILQPPAGWLAQRFDVRVTLFVGVVLWALATILMGISAAFWQFLILRVLLGVGESVAYPCNSKLLAQGLPEHRRGRANGLLAAGQALGVAFGTLVGGLIMTHFGWRAVFVTFGLLSLIWVAPWLQATYEKGAAVAANADWQTLPYRVLLTRMELWGASVGNFCSLYAYYFLLTWLPLFLVRAYGFTVTNMALIASGVYTLHALSSTAVGRISDRLIESGLEACRVRQRFLVSGLIGIALLMLVSAGTGPTQSVILIASAAILFGTQTPNVLALPQMFAGQRGAGQWMGIQNFFGNLAGIVAPAVTGHVLDKTGHHTWAFVVAAFMAAAGAVVFAAMLPANSTSYKNAHTP